MPIKKKMFDVRELEEFNNVTESHDVYEDTGTNTNHDDTQNIEVVSDIVGEEFDFGDTVEKLYMSSEEFTNSFMTGNLELTTIKMLVSQYYQTQKTRIAFGNRIFAAFIQSIGIAPGTSVYENPHFRQLMKYAEENYTDKEDTKTKKTKTRKSTSSNESVAKENEKAKNKVIEYIKREYGLITKAVADIIFKKQQVELFSENKILFTMVQEASICKLEKALYTIFKKNCDTCDYKFILSTSIYHMVKSFIQYINIEKQIYNRISIVVNSFPIWTEYVQYIKGFGPLTMACFLAKIDIEKCKKFSSLLAYFGYDTVLNPNTGLREGRCNGFRKNMEHHKVTRYRPVKDGDHGEMEEYKSISYSPFMKTKMFNLAGCIIKSRNELYTTVFNEYKARQEERNKTADKPITNGHIRMRSIRYMNKFILQDIWYHWRLLEGLPVTIPYPDAYLNHESHIRTINLEQSTFAGKNPKVVIELIDWSKLDDPKYLSGKLLSKLRHSEKAA